MRAGKRQRRRHAVAQQLGDEKFGGNRVVVRRGKAGFLRKGVSLQPRQQPLGGRANHVHLRVVDVHIDKARRDDAPRKMRHRHPGKARRQLLVRPDGQNRLPALGVGAGDQQAVGFKNGLRRGRTGGALVGKVKNRSAVGFHGHESTSRPRPASQPQPDAHSVTG